jgi:bifunctional DNA-binding transcriptional regulator/antitoxin component of YhaV-PrlF toxin-antitoxin module
VNSIKIIGLPVVVSNRHRIVLDKNIRTLFEIQKNDSVFMNIEQGFLRISSCQDPTVAGGEKKNITIGRFNLPESWAKENDIHIGDFVYLIATDTGIVICPKNIELLCIGGGL